MADDYSLNEKGLFGKIYETVKPAICTGLAALTLAVGATDTAYAWKGLERKQGESWLGSIIQAAQMPAEMHEGYFAKPDSFPVADDQLKYSNRFKDYLANSLDYEVSAITLTNGSHTQYLGLIFDPKKNPTSLSLAEDCVPPYEGVLGIESLTDPSRIKLIYDKMSFDKGYAVVPFLAAGQVIPCTNKEGWQEKFLDLYVCSAKEMKIQQNGSNWKIVRILDKDVSSSGDKDKGTSSASGGTSSGATGSSSGGGRGGGAGGQ